MRRINRRPYIDTTRLGKLEPAVQTRILYADTDAMGIVYHGNYVRFLEAARVEVLRRHREVWAGLNREHLTIALSDMALQYHAPARFDDFITVSVGVTQLTRVRMNFHYRITIEAGDRQGLDERLEILTAETRHVFCPATGTIRAERVPPELFEELERHFLLDPSDRL